MTRKKEAIETAERINALLRQSCGNVVILETGKSFNYSYMKASFYLEAKLLLWRETQW